MPADARASYRLSPNNPGLLGLQLSQRERAASWLVDPHNRHPWSVLRNEADYAEDERPDSPCVTVSTVTLPRAPVRAWIEGRADVPASRITEHRVRSVLLGNERLVWVYTPPGYTSDRASCPLVVCFDGHGYIHAAAAPTTLDNLQHAGKLPPVVAAFVDTPLPTRGHELPCNDRFAEFVTEELLPWLQERYAVSRNPSERVLAGVSFGGLAATFIAINHPDVFGCVLSQGGSFYWPAEEDGYERIARQLAGGPRLPIRFHLDVGRFDTAPRPGSCPTILTANRHLRDVLTAKGYDLHYQEFSGGHEFLGWRGTFADGLMALLGQLG